MKLELPITGLHAVGIDALPAVHRDPFNRLSRALAEGLPLLTADDKLARYGGPVRKV